MFVSSHPWWYIGLIPTFTPGFRLLPGLRSLFVVFLAVAALPFAAHAASRVAPVPVPQEMLSSAFTVTVNGQPVDVAHAAASYEWVSFDITGPVDIAITAAEAGFWIGAWISSRGGSASGQFARGRRFGSTWRVGEAFDFASRGLSESSEDAVLFAGTPPPLPPTGSNVHIIAAGIHRESLNPKSGDTYYLAPGVHIRQPEPLEGWRGEGAGTGHDCVRGVAGSDHR